MTLLIFVASIAVMEYVLRREAKKPAHTPPQWAHRALGPTAIPASKPTPTESLLALGDALHQHGRGQTPGSADLPAKKIVRP